MASWSWTLLNVIACSIGLKAVYDLRAEHARGARTWTLLAWALWFYVAMEVAMAAASLAPALWLLSVTTGLVSAPLSEPAHKARSCVGAAPRPAVVPSSAFTT